VPVVIYRMTAEDEARLDRFEGYPKYYYKREFLLPVWSLKGRRLKKRRECIAYIMHEKRLLGEPTQGYYGSWMRATGTGVLKKHIWRTG
jgi:hypothetical protein